MSYEQFKCYDTLRNEIPLNNEYISQSQKMNLSKPKTETHNVGHVPFFKVNTENSRKYLSWTPLFTTNTTTTNNQLQTQIRSSSIAKLALYNIESIQVSNRFSSNWKKTLTSKHTQIFERIPLYITKFEKIKM